MNPTDPTFATKNPAEHRRSLRAAKRSNRKPGGRWLRSGGVAVALLGVGLLIYRDFVFGGKTLLYKDIGTDSLNAFYPLYCLLSRYLRQVGIPSWSFHVGMGQNLFPYVGAVALTPVVWLPQSLIAVALVYQHLLYTVIAGSLFALFLKDRGASFPATLLGALLIAFSAYLCMGSCWYFHAYEVVCFTFLLFAAERAVSRGRWAYVSVAVAVVALLGAFHLYLSALLLCLYVPARLLARCSDRPLKALFPCLVLAAAAALGVGLTAVASLDNLHALLNSPRGSGLTSRVSSLTAAPVFGLDSELNYLTAALRVYANDMLGTGNDFRGWQNYLEAPMSYCGLVCLLLVPQAFVGAARRRRIVYMLLVGAMVIPVVFPWWRYVFWAFQGEYYRTFTLFSVFGLVTLAMMTFTKYEQGARLNIWLLAGSLLLLIGFLYLPLPKLQALINPSLRRYATILLSAYAALFVFGQLLKHQRIVTWLVICLAAGELIYLDQITVSSRDVVTKKELSERVGYNDETVDALREIQSNDTTFFRVTKTWGSGLGKFDSINDALVFGYNGTASYSSFNDVNYIRFLIGVDAIPLDELAKNTQWAVGLGGHPLLATFAGEKYVLTTEPEAFEALTPYQRMQRYGRVQVYRNLLWVPFGLTFDRYIPESLFLQLPAEAKGTTLMLAAVLSDEAASQLPDVRQLTLNELNGIVNGTSMGETVESLRNTALRIHFFSETRMEGTIRLSDRNVMVLQIPFDPGWRALQDGAPVATVKVDIGLLGIPLEKGEHVIQLRYRPPYVVEGAFISAAAWLILMLLLWLAPRLRLSNGTPAS